MISVENLSKSFGGHVLFDHVGFQLNPRERLGLVGPNGHGKTTLLRMLIGEEEPDGGKILIPKNYRIAHVRQQLRFTRPTVLEECMTDLPAHAEGQQWQAEKILSGLGFSEQDMQRPPETFSGGFQVRLNLAKILVSEPDLLLLDEPTNYLDITSIRWVEKYLTNWPHELILITHDRSFMDHIATHILGIHRCKLRKLPGNTEKYYNQIAQDEEIYEKTRINDERRRKEIELFISRFRAKARLANLVQSRIKLLSKMESKKKLDRIRSLDFAFRSKPFPGKIMMRVEEVRFGYDPDKPLIDGLSFMVNKGDRICVIGRNGKGKTTLLKLLAGTLTPQQGGIVHSPNTAAGFFEQTNIAGLVDSRSVEEEIMCSQEDIDRQAARNICGAMMFGGDDALKKIGVLSGGEKSRVMLGKLLVTPVNLLLLDEPTNHLDMESCDALLAAIDAFEATVIMVTHNEMFLHALAQRLLVFQGDRIDLFEGSYQRFLDSGGWEEETNAAQSARNDKASFKPGKKELRRLRSEIITEKGRVLKPLEKRLNEIEDAIDAAESQLKQLTDNMQAATEDQDVDRIEDISRTMHDCQTRIDTLFEEMERVGETFEKQSAFFAAKLADLENRLVG
jgi:ATP-binding cassette subfamily F protein 3